MADGDLLRDALATTTGARAIKYGHPSRNLTRSAKMVDAYLEGLDRELTVTDFAAIMVLVKLARLHQSPYHYDSLMDAAGWMSAAWDALQETGEADDD